MGCAGKSLLVAAGFAFYLKTIISLNQPTF
jgi:hypothetical protein